MTDACSSSQRDTGERGDVNESCREGRLEGFKFSLTALVERGNDGVEDDPLSFPTVPESGGRL